MHCLYHNSSKQEMEFFQKAIFYPPPLGVHPFLNFKGAKGLKVSIWSMMEGSKEIL